MTTIQTPAFSGDAYTQLATMAAQLDEQDRSIARETEDAADAAADQSEEDRVAEMRAKAQDTESSALASGIAGMAGGLCGLVGALVPSSGEAEASGRLAGGAAAGTSSPSRLACALDAGSKSISNAGGIVAGVYAGNAARHDAAAAQDEADAQADLRQSSRAHDDVQAARSSLDRVTTFLDETQQSENAARSAAVSVRG